MKLLYDRIDICRKLYGVPENIQEFILDIDDNITCYADKYYLTQIFDNLIINAITYNKGGKIKITLKYPIGVIKFSISDEETNIPEEALLDIFEAFTLTSRTYTPDGGWQRYRISIM